MVYNKSMAHLLVRLALVMAVMLLLVLLILLTAGVDPVW